MLTKIPLFCSCRCTYDFCIVVVFGTFFLYLECTNNYGFRYLFLCIYLSEHTYDSALIVYFKCNLDIQYFFIYERTYNPNFVFDFLFILVSPQSFIWLIRIFLASVVFKDFLFSSLCNPGFWFIFHQLCVNHGKAIIFICVWLIECLVIFNTFLVQDQSFNSLVINIL